jgi:hypothetical protein
MRLSIDSRFHAAEPVADQEFRQGQLFGSPIARASLGAAALIADVFDGGPKTRVAMRIGERAPIEMTRRAAPDPFVAEVYARNANTKKAWVKAETSSHLWSARLPSDLPPGAHRVVVEATTEYGDVVTGRMALEVTG